jgi:hypothetical protein
MDGGLVPDDLAQFLVNDVRGDQADLTGAGEL